MSGVISISNMEKKLCSTLKNRYLVLAEKLNLITEVKNGKPLCEAAILVNFIDGLRAKKCRSPKKII